VINLGRLVSVNLGRIRHADDSSVNPPDRSIFR
jgi:hypothetical protein